MKTKKSKFSQLTWRERQDAIYMYKMDKYFTFDKGNAALIEESCRWRFNDLKGNRMTYYLKEVVKKND